MDIGISFGYMFEDRDWLKKILIGGLISLIPIVNFAALGYLVQIIRNVRDGQALPLPEWDQFGDYFMSGLWLFVVFLLYSIPLIILACLQGIGTVVLGSSGNPSDDVATAYMVVSVCLSCLMAIWGLAIGILSPAILVRFAETGQVGPTMRFGGLMDVIRVNVGGYVIVLLLMWVVSSIIAPLGLILCVVGVVFTQFWAYLVSGHLLGQLANEARGLQPVSL
jgi:hypothetical protein